MTEVFIFRFAEYILNGCWHISREEISAHDTLYDPPSIEPDSVSDNGSDNESELYFVLGNPNMTVRL